MKILLSLIFVILLSPLVLAQVNIGSTPPDIKGVVILPPDFVSTLTTIGGNLTQFLNLTDTPSSYSGSGSDCVKVNVGENALEFGACAAGGGDNSSWNQSFAEDLFVEESGDTMTGNLTLPSILVNGAIKFLENGAVMNGGLADFIVFTKGIAIQAPFNLSVSGSIALDGVIGNATDDFTLADFLLNTDTNATTQCSGGELPLGNGSCIDSSGFGGGGAANNDGLFINYTQTRTTGNISNGALVGYTAGDKFCNDEVATGSHMCQMFEVINSVRLRGFNNFTATFRASEGAPGFTTNANDCVGWRDDDGTFLGSIWVGNNVNGGQGALVGCDVERAIGCCL